MRPAKRKSFTQWFKELSEEDQQFLIPFLRAEQEDLDFKSRAEDFRKGHFQWKKKEGVKL